MAQGMVQRNARTVLLAILGPALLLCGCSDRGDFPSLARRPAEDAYRTARAAPPAPPPPAVMTPGMAGRLADLRAQAAQAQTAFETARPAASRAVSAAQGAGRGSERWSVASVALAQLESARARAGLPLAELDRLETEASQRAAVEGSDADLRAVLDARREVEALVGAQTRVIDSLLASLAG